MKPHLTLAICLLILSFATSATPASQPTTPASPMITPASQPITTPPPVFPLPPACATTPAQQVAPPSADEIIKQACTEAAASHKKVMVLFHASWCKWCHKLDTLMASPECKPLFDQSFVICHLTVAESPDKRDQENPGAQELYAKYADQNSGIPFFLIMTSDGAVIADSRIKPAGAKPGSSGDNIGYPATKAEVDYYLRTLQETTDLTKAQLETIRKKLPKA